MTEQNEHLALWGGRFSSGPSPELARLSKSTQFDWRLADDDIAGSRAHARALGRAGLLTTDELNRMEEALDELQRRVDSGAFAPIEDDEDEATALERGLLEIAGDELGGKLRAGRSRNDQIACLIRMWLRRHARRVAGAHARPGQRADRPVRAGRGRGHARAHPYAARPAGAARPSAHGPRLAAAARRATPGGLGRPHRRQPVRFRRPGWQHARPGPAERGRGTRVLPRHRQLDRRHRLARSGRRVRVRGGHARRGTSRA